MPAPAYQLYYWPNIQGRGEFVRLALEDAGAPYVDVARLTSKSGGIPAMMKVLGRKSEAPFAPPVLRWKGGLVWQRANILHALGPTLRLAPRDEAKRVYLLGVEMTVSDLVNEVHDTHHPISTSAYYEEQKSEARARSKAFCSERIPKYLGYFERLVGKKAQLTERHTYVDLSLFQVMSGLEYAFPRTMKRMAPKLRNLTKLKARIEARPNIAAYLASDRRIAFNTDGIFRHYPELES